MTYIFWYKMVYIAKSFDAIVSILGLLFAEIQAVLYVNPFHLSIISFLLMKFSLKLMKLKIRSFLYETLGF